MLGRCPQPQQASFPALPPEVRNGLAQLLRAFDYARDLGCSPWDFSVEMERLLAAGMTTSDLRWLVQSGYLLHAREVSGADDSARQFGAESQGLVLFPNTCFVLTAAGLALLGREVSTTEHVTTGDVLPISAVASFPLHEGSPAAAAILPHWDPDSRLFTVGEHLVKQFRVPSRNQEAVLNAFQEEGWPRFVDDPLPPLRDQDPKRRLRDTIKCLNMNQVERAIRFRGDGTGQRVLWELLSDAIAPAAGASSPLRRVA